MSGTIRKKIVAPIEFKGYTVHASREEPRYLIESDKTDHLAMHKGSALRRLSGRGPSRAASRTRPCAMITTSVRRRRSDSQLTGPPQSGFVATQVVKI